MTNFEVIMIGSPCIDEYYTLDSPLAMGEKALGAFINNKIGGMISNAAAVIASYGVRTALIDTMNHSNNSNLLIDEMKKLCVDTSMVSYDEGLTDVKCLIFLYKGERSIVVVKNNKTHLAFTPHQEQRIMEAKALYSTIYEMELYDDAPLLLKKARERDVEIVFDVEQGSLSRNKSDFKYLNNASIIFINEGGCDALVSCYGSTVFERIIENGTIIVKTRGAKGCSVMCKDEEDFVSPAFPVERIDTTGAGDTFNSSFLYGILQKWSLKECARFANGAAGRAITFLGAQSGACGLESVKVFIESFNMTEH